MRTVIAALLLGTAVVAGAAVHGPADREPRASAPAYDEKQALQISQAALGKTPHDAMFTRADDARDGGRSGLSMPSRGITPSLEGRGTTPGTEEVGRRREQPPRATQGAVADNGRVRLSDYRGKPLVVSLVYTSCYHICPTTTQHLAKIVRTARAALGTDSFRVVTIGFDTPKDTPVAMARFAREQRVDLPGWDFLSADAETMRQLTANLGFLYFNAPQGFDHLIQATVIDADGKVYRQVYGMNFDTPLLVEPLKELVFGTPRTASFLESLGNRIKLFCTVYDPATDRYRFDYSIFLGGVIGLTSLGLVAFLVVREWRRKRPSV